MIDLDFPSDFSGVTIFFVGIKGTGMAALAELLFRKGAVISGSDVSEVFYTDEILSRLGIPFFESFDAGLLPSGTRLVIYSAAYQKNTNPQLIEAARRKIPLIEYTEALGLLSENMFSCGIAGVHGKTTTTALTGTLLQKLKLPVSVLVGSGVSNFGGSSVLVLGDTWFVAETCEYRRHFLHFNPDVVVITSIEPDHLDYFKDMEDIVSAFVSYGLKLPQRGRLIYCADDPGTVEAVRTVHAQRPDIRCIGYGRKAEGRFKLLSYGSSSGRTYFTLGGFPGTFFIRIPGYHIILDALAALAVTLTIIEEEGAPVTPRQLQFLADAMEDFAGCKRRSEIIGEWNDILIMDDYGHHPTEIKTTLEGLRAFYPGRRLVVDFMSHTYSRTEALLDDFAGAFGAADMVILHKIYASAREEKGRISGKTLFERMKEKHPRVFYFEEVPDALPFCREQLKSGDLFITLGAGDNWTLGREIASFLKERTAP